MVKLSAVKPKHCTKRNCSGFIANIEILIRAVLLQFCRGLSTLVNMFAWYVFKIVCNQTMTDLRPSFLLSP